jgi:hypothetical protein
MAPSNILSCAVTALNFPNNVGEGALNTPFSGLGFAVSPLTPAGQVLGQTETGPGGYVVTATLGTEATLDSNWFAAGYEIVNASGLPTNQSFVLNIEGPNPGTTIYVRAPDVISNQGGGWL